MVSEVLTTEFTTSSGKKIYVFENLFDFATRSQFYNFAITSMFKIDGTDSKLLENKEHLSLVSIYTPYDVERLEVLSRLPTEILEKFNISNDTMQHAMINLCSPSDRFHTHVDNNLENSWTLVYYLNLEWSPEWGGETIFLDEEGINFEHVSQFKPGKLIIFDPRIPHMIRPSTVLAPHFRFTFAAKFIA
jgi:Rps23 Pro-64 3,4-dihydroxylase Tpa1-like proline 4-hydroxylase